MTPLTAAEWFYAADKFEVGDGCWLWVAGVNTEGYGWFGRRSGNARAYRLLWEELHGPVPSGLVLDHLCRNRLCVRPSHLEPVTDRTNILRGFGRAANQARQTECHLGHPLDRQGNRRRCLTCTNARARERYAARQVA